MELVNILIFYVIWENQWQCFFSSLFFFLSFDVFLIILFNITHHSLHLTYIFCAALAIKRPRPRSIVSFLTWKPPKSLLQSNFVLFYSCGNSAFCVLVSVVWTWEGFLERDVAVEFFNVISRCSGHYIHLHCTGVAAEISKSLSAWPNTTRSK